MQRISHLQKVLIVMVITFALAFRIEAWWNSLFIVLYFYYFLFISNLFVKIYEKENRLTKFFFGITELPMIFAGVTIAFFIILIRKWYHLENLDSAYLNAFVGALATTIARYKRGKIIRKSE